jgi:pyruvate formate lyase activating enzyme
MNNPFFIAGFEPFTLNDYPSKPACIIFIAGCNLRCRYCHNPELVLPVKIKNRFEEVKIFLKERKVNNLVITGGEPLYYNLIKELIMWIKSLKISIKLDTNGFYPCKLKKLLSEKLIDYVALDIKALNNKDLQYITRQALNISHYYETIEILNKYSIPYELRFTKWKNYSEKEWTKFYTNSNSKVKVKIQKLRLEGKILDKTFRNIF